MARDLLRSWTRCRGGSRIFLGGGALVSCSTSTPINHIVFFWQNTSCIRKPQVISGEGGAHPLHPPPRSAPEMTDIIETIRAVWENVCMYKDILQLFWVTHGYAIWLAEPTRLFSDLPLNEVKYQVIHMTKNDKVFHSYANKNCFHLAGFALGFIVLRVNKLHWWVRTLRIIPKGLTRWIITIPHVCLYLFGFISY